MNALNIFTAFCLVFSVAFNVLLPLVTASSFVGCCLLTSREAPADPRGICQFRQNVCRQGAGRGGGGGETVFGWLLQLWQIGRARLIFS